MSLACRISFKNGVVAVSNADGTPSKLYQDALALTKDPGKALAVWSNAYSEDFTTKVRQHTDDVSLEEVLKYMDTNNSVSKRLTQEGRLQLVSLMEKNNISTLSELSTKLVGIFKPNGILKVDVKKALASGLYTEDDIQTLDLKEVDTVLHQIEGELLVSDISVEYGTDLKPTYSNPAKKTIIGSSVKINDAQVEQELVKKIENFQSIESIEKAIRELPYQNFIDKYNTDDNFREDLNKRLSNFKRVQSLTLVDNELAVVVGRNATIIANTFPANVDTKELNAYIGILSNISQEVWDDKNKLVIDILKDIESKMVKEGVDIIGTSIHALNRRDVLDLLTKLNIALQSPTEQNLAEYTLANEKLLGEEDASVVIPNDNDLTTYRVELDLTEGELFEQHDLIKVGDNTYQKINDTADDLREAVYQKFINDEILIPNKFITVEDAKDINNKETILDNISAWVATRPTSFKTIDKERLVLAQIYYNHPQVKIKKVDGVAAIKTNPDYLKTSFVLDFYQYMLEEKAKGSEVYTDVLSNFTVTDKDISLVGEVKSISNTKYEQELKDYIRLKKDSQMDHLVEPTSTRYLTEAHIALNNPQSVSEYKGIVVIKGDYLASESLPNDFIRRDGNLYRRVIKGANTNLYKKVKTPTSNIYFEADVEHYFNKEEAFAMMEVLNDSFPRKETFAKQSIVEKSEKLSQSALRLKAKLAISSEMASTLTDAEEVTFPGEDKAFEEIDACN